MVYARHLRGKNEISRVMCTVLACVPGGVLFHSGNSLYRGVGSRFGVPMGCKACKSENLQKLEGELSANFPGINALNVPPVYVCQRVLVCLDCGFAELVVPTRELQLLQKGAASLDR